MRKSGRLAVFVGLACMLAAESGSAAISGLERVASELAAPIFATHPPGDRDRLFIVERGSPAESTNASAAIRILDLNTGSVLATPYLTITNIDNRGEGGLLGMAFHPDYQTNGKFYVYLTAADSIAGTFFSSYVREYTLSADPNVASTSFNPVITWGQPQSNHNAGWIGFSPNDGYLYISSGDGGGGNDDDTGHTPGTGNAQDITDNLLGKMLRINVNADDFPADADRNYAIPPTNPFKAGVGDPADDAGDDEIWAYGLRNPFRDSFDRITGDLWIGDVGQSQREEIDFQPASSTGAENYGWRLREGLIQTPGVGGNKPPGNVDPVYDYNRDADQFGGTVVTGGYVYRGPDPSLQGQYFFADSRNSPETEDDNYWMFDPADPFGTVMNIDSLLFPTAPADGTVQFPVSFGEDAVGNLYIAYIASGEVYRIVTNELLAGDFNADGAVDAADYVVWRKTDGTQPKYDEWRSNFGESVHAGAGAGGGSAGVPEPAAAAYLGQLIGLLAIAATARRSRRRLIACVYCSRGL
jgi:glucose/arabinose dehydrogenase